MGSTQAWADYLDGLKNGAEVLSVFPTLAPRHHWMSRDYTVLCGTTWSHKVVLLPWIWVLYGTSWYYTSVHQPDFASQPAAGPGRRRFIILTRSDASLPLHWDRATGMKTLHATDRPANYRTVWISDVHLGFSGCRRSSSSTPALDALRSALSCRDHPPERAPYRNSGDWVESCTALIELHGGTRELSHWSDACHTRGSRCRRPDPKV
jgi:hypothetical protein